MEALLHSPTSRLVARPVGVVLSHVYALAPILNPSLAARIALVITKRRESAILSHVQVSSIRLLLETTGSNQTNDFNWISSSRLKSMRSNLVVRIENVGFAFPANCKYQTKDCCFS